MLAEIIVTWNVYWEYINIYKGDAAKIFKNIGDLINDLLINIDMVSFEIIKIWDRYSWYQSTGYRMRINIRKRIGLIGLIFF